MANDTYIAAMLAEIGWYQWQSKTPARYPVFEWNEVLAEQNAPDAVLLSTEPYRFTLQDARELKKNCKTRSFNGWRNAVLVRQPRNLWTGVFKQACRGTLKSQTKSYQEPVQNFLKSFQPRRKEAKKWNVYGNAYVF